MVITYEVNDDTLAILPYDEGYTRVVEMDDEYIVKETPYEVMEHSCEYFGSSFDGRMLGTKSILGTVYKAPIVVEETKKLIFFPTEALQSENVGWISYSNVKGVEKMGKQSRIIFKNDNNIVVNCPYFSIRNQIFRCNLLDAVSTTRKENNK